jgi:hypothetical protein
MLLNLKMAMAETRIQNIYKDLKKEFPYITILGVTKEEKEITKKVHAAMWLVAFEQKPGKYKEADEFIRTIIICNSVMVDLGIINERAEIVTKH